MPEVETDLASIWWYGYWNFGLKQAELYAQRMQQRFKQLAEHE
jgi:toxin ParE1/3/4